MITPGIVVFNPAQFIAQFPAFATVSTFNGSGSLSATSAVLTITGVVSGALKVGDTVYDAAASVAGATVSSLGSGTGGTGTYNLSAPAAANATGDSIVVSAALASNFTIACLMLNNSVCSVVQDAPTRASLLNLLTAHITALLSGANSNAPIDRKSVV